MLLLLTRGDTSPGIAFKFLACVGPTPARTLPASSAQKSVILFLRSSLFRQKASRDCCAASKHCIENSARRRRKRSRRLRVHPVMNRFPPPHPASPRPDPTRNLGSASFVGTASDCYPMPTVSVPPYSLPELRTVKGRADGNNT